MNNTKNIRPTALDEIVTFLKAQPGSRPQAIADAVGVSRQYVQKMLQDKETFDAYGSGPNRFYRLASVMPEDNVTEEMVGVLDDDQRKQIDSNFYALTPLGAELVGVNGFYEWCRQRGFNFEQKAREYIGVLKKYYPETARFPIDFTHKLKTTFSDLSVDKIWASDFYAFEIFGKSKLGTLVTVAKQVGDSDSIKALAERLDRDIKTIQKTHRIDALAFVSPTLQRQVQLMSKLDLAIDKSLPRIRVYKVGAKILIAQKTLKTIQDRVLNAAQTFVVESDRKFENVLIIDDALGSGATINEVAKLIKQKDIGEHCYSIVLVASPNGYEVINEA